MSRATMTAADRVDAEIFGKARSALDGRPDVPATVRVHVNNGAVTLTGSVRFPSEQAAAEDAVRHVAGIHCLFNRIVVAAINPQGVEPPDDRD